MTAVPVAEHMTAAKFLDLPVPERGRPWNLVNGEVIVNQPTRLHGRVLGELQFALESWARAEPGRGEVAVPLDVQLNDRNVFAPDVSWYTDLRRGTRVEGSQKLVSPLLPGFGPAVKRLFSDE